MRTRIDFSPCSSVPPCLRVSVVQFLTFCPLFTLFLCVEDFVFGCGFAYAAVKAFGCGSAALWLNWKEAEANGVR